MKNTIIETDGNKITVNNQWSFILPDGISYETDAEFDGGIQGRIDLSGPIKPMVLKGLYSSGKYLFNVSLEPHDDLMGKNYTVTDCRYDNKFRESRDINHREIIIDDDEYYVDCCIENTISLGAFVQIRIRGKEIEPFNFFTGIKDMDNSDWEKVKEKLRLIAESIVFLNRTAGEKTGTARKKTNNNPDFVIEYGTALKYIGNSADVVFPDGITDIADDICRGIDDITSLVIPEGVVSIGDRAFKNCTSLKTVRLPSTLESIGSYVFVDCHNLTEINLQDTKLKDIPCGMFSECFNLDNVTLPKTIEYIDCRGFTNCWRFTEFVVPSKCKGIGHSAFSRCKELEYLYIPKSVTEFGQSFIGDKPFTGCDKLTVYGSAGSEAEKYCSAEGINFEVASRPKKTGPSDIPVDERQSGGLLSMLFGGFSSVTFDDDNPDDNSASTKRTTSSAQTASASKSVKESVDKEKSERELYESKIKNDAAFCKGELKRIDNSLKDVDEKISTLESENITRLWLKENIKVLIILGIVPAFMILIIILFSWAGAETGTITILALLVFSPILFIILKNIFEGISGEKIFHEHKIEALNVQKSALSEERKSIEKIMASEPGLNAKNNS